jgi:hypothetical protein
VRKKEPIISAKVSCSVRVVHLRFSLVSWDFLCPCCQFLLGRNSFVSERAPQLFFGFGEIWSLEIEWIASGLPRWHHASCFPQSEPPMLENGARKVPPWVALHGDTCSVWRDIHSVSRYTNSTSRGVYADLRSGSCNLVVARFEVLGRRHAVPWNGSERMMMALVGQQARARGRAP